MKKTETIALYRDEYLKGKSEEECIRFDEKDIEKQYGAIMAWKRRTKAAAADKVKNDVSVSAIVAVLKKAKADIPTLKTLSDNDKSKLYEALNGALDEVTNFERYKKMELLRHLESERDKITKQGDDLTRQIDEIRQQLG